MYIYAHVCVHLLRRVAWVLHTSRGQGTLDQYATHRSDTGPLVKGNTTTSWNSRTSPPPVNTPPGKPHLTSLPRRTSSGAYPITRNMSRSTPPLVQEYVRSTTTTTTTILVARRQQDEFQGSSHPKDKSFTSSATGLKITSHKVVLQENVYIYRIQRSRGSRRTTP